MSDWSSDVCSSDLRLERRRITFNLTLVYQTPPALLEEVAEILRALVESHEKCTFIGAGFVAFGASSLDHEIGRASCRDRVCKSVYTLVVALYINKNTTSEYTLSHNIPINIY